MPRRKKSSQENHSRSINKEKPQQRYAANARERARMRVLSRAFCRLKTTLPWVPADTKLSKLDTLRLAASYIAHLKGIMREEPLSTSESSLHPAMSMTWPFGFNRPLGGSTGGGSREGGSLEGSEEDDEDDDVDDEESISSCTWEEVSPPPAKDCVHLVGTGRRARGKGNSQVLAESCSENAQKSHTTNLSNTSHEHHDTMMSSNTNTSSRILSQNQHHQHQSHYATGMEQLHHHKLASPNLENGPQAELFAGVGGNNDAFIADMNNPYQHHHQQQQQQHGECNENESLQHHHLHHHQINSSVPFGFGGDVISIG